jgi:hypothetical protein
LGKLNLILFWGLSSFNGLYGKYKIMNKIERIVYDRVKKNVKLKNLIRNIYQYLLAIIPKKKMASEYEINTFEGYFFGFHDKIPWSSDETKILAHKINNSNKDFSNIIPIDIGYFEKKVFHNLGSTKSWNWQQGSMLQWVGSTDDIIFNDWDGSSNISKRININGNIIKLYDRPIASVSPDGKYATSYSFDRLNIGMPGYGYCNVNSSEDYANIPSDSFLSVIELENGSINNLFSIKYIVETFPNPIFDESYNFFSHTIISPDSQKLLFLHRWRKGKEELYSRLFTCNIDGSNLKLYPTSGMVSHLSWIDSSSIVTYCETEKYGDAYHVFNIDGTYKILDKKQLDCDGHPQFCNKNGLFVTDTYANGMRMQQLSVYDIKKERKDLLAKLYSPLKYKEEIRCDLHPRWNRTGTKICFDSVHTGKRALCILDYKRDLKHE